MLDLRCSYVVREGGEGTSGRAETSRGGRMRTEERNQGNHGRSRSPRPAGYRGTISTISGGEGQAGDRDRQRDGKAYQSYQILTGANLTPLGERKRGTRSCLMKRTEGTRRPATNRW
ncbi:hypothetical protein CR513_59920, partial [Mucuna pruriens]